MPRFPFLLLGLLFVPMFVGAQETPESLAEIPVYLFIAENGDVWIAAPITKHIFNQEGNVIATVETESGNTSVYYVHTDHLTGSNVVTDGSGNQVQLLDYYPFGGIRLDEKTSSFDEQRKFTGHEYDDDTGLSYMVARYYDGGVGRFTAQDPVFLAAGTNNKLAKAALSNPQFLNSYSYTANNPLKYVDEEGEFPFLIVAALVVGGVFLSDVEIAQAPDVGQT